MRKEPAELDAMRYAIDNFSRGASTRDDAKRAAA